MVKGTLSYIFKNFLHNISLSLPHQIHNSQKSNSNLTGQGKELIAQEQ